MKITTTRLHLAIIIYILIFLCSCSEKPKTAVSEESSTIIPELNIDSLFVNLNEASIAEKSRIIDEKMQRLHKRAGFNGVVLYAEQGQLDRAPPS